MDDADADLAHYGAALADAVAAVLPSWVVRSVVSVGGAPLGDEAEAAGAAAVDDVVPRLRALLAADVDAQPTTPLSLLRDAVRFPTDVLRRAGIPPAPRDEQARRLHPDDDYGLTPATFADVDPALAEPGLVWGAAKGRAHLARRRRG